MFNQFYLLMNGGGMIYAGIFVSEIVGPFMIPKGVKMTSAKYLV